MSTISTHVLDTALGRPAAGIRVVLDRLDDGDRHVTSIGSGQTDADGRLRDFVSPGVVLGTGVFRLRFDVAEYFAQSGREAFYPEVVVVFTVRGGTDHYHVPLLLSPYGYSTYRGS